MLLNISTYLLILSIITSSIILPSNSCNANPASALRAPSLKTSASGQDIADDLRKDKGSFSVTTPCWEKYLELKSSNFESAKLWSEFVNTTKTIGDVEFLTAAFNKLGHYMPEETKVSIENRIKAAKRFAKEMDRAPKAVIETVEVIATEDGFEIAAKGQPDNVLKDLGIPVDKLRFRNANGKGDTVVVSADNQLYVVDKEKALIWQGKVFAADRSGRFFIFGIEGKLCRFRFKDSDAVAILEDKEIFEITLSPDSELLLVYLKEDDSYHVDIYKVGEDAIDVPYRQFADVGTPEEMDAIGFSPDSKQVIFNYSGAGAQIFDIESGEPIIAEPVSKGGATTDEKDEIIVIEDKPDATTDVVSAAEKIKALSVNSPVSDFIECAGLAVDLEQLGAVASAFAKKVKAKSLLNAVTDPVKAAIAARKKALETGKTGEAGHPVLPATGAAAKAGSDIIELVDGDVDEEGSSISDALVDKKAEPAKPKSARELLEEAVKQFAKAMKPSDVDAIMQQYLKLSKDQAYQKAVRHKAQKRTEWLDTLHKFSRSIRTAMDAAVLTERGADETTQAWLGKVEESFLQAIRAKQEEQSLSMFEKNTTAYKEVKAVINNNRKLFSSWKEKLVGAEALSSTAVNFVQLEEFQAKVKKSFEKLPNCLKALETLIEKGKQRLKSAQAQARNRVKPLAAVVRDEYVKLYTRLKEFNQALKELDAAAEKAGFKGKRAQVTNLPNFEAAATAAIDYQYRVVDRQLIRYEYQGQRTSRLVKLWPLRGPVKKAVSIRKAVLKQLREYKRARRVISDNFTPEAFLLGPEQTREFDSLVNTLALEGMPAEVARIFKKNYQINSVLDYLMGIDNYLQHLWQKLIFIRTRERYTPVIEQTRDYIQQHVLAVEPAVNLARFEKAHKIKPASSAVVSESKITAMVDSQA